MYSHSDGIIVEAFSSSNDADKVGNCGATEILTGQLLYDLECGTTETPFLVTRIRITKSSISD